MNDRYSIGYRILESHKEGDIRVIDEVEVISVSTPPVEEDRWPRRWAAVTIIALAALSWLLIGTIVAVVIAGLT